MSPKPQVQTRCLPASLLKHCAHVLHKPLAHIFSLSLKLGIFPKQWKIADVVALHKKKSKSDPCNYRPISLLPIVSKLLEQIVNDQLSKFLAPKLNMHQFGFRAGHTTTDLLTLMSQSWKDALAAGSEARAVALDISKAFDRVWHEGLLHKLQLFVVSGPLLAWLRSFLSARSQRVVVGVSGSSFRPV